MGLGTTGVTVSRTVVDDTPEGSIHPRPRYETPPVAEETHPMSNMVFGVFTGLPQPPVAEIRDIRLEREEERALSLIHI